MLFVSPGFPSVCFILPASPPFLGSRCDNAFFRSLYIPCLLLLFLYAPLFPTPTVPFLSASLSHIFMLPVSLPPFPSLSSFPPHEQKKQQQYIYMNTPSIRFSFIHIPDVLSFYCTSLLILKSPSVPCLPISFYSLLPSLIFLISNSLLLPSPKFILFPSSL